MTTAAPQLHDLSEFLRRRAGEYFPEFSGDNVSIALTSSKRRRFSQTFLFALRSGSDERHVFAKLPLDAPSIRRAEADTATDRPRLMPLVTADSEAQLEYAALRNLSAHFSAYDQARLGVPRVLDLFAGQAIIAENLDLPTLDRVVAQASRWRFGSAAKDMAPEFRAAGQWLQVLHSKPATESDVAHVATRDEFLLQISRFCEYLSRATQQHTWFQSLQTSLQRAAAREMPAVLSLAIGHGDFGLHNLFVTPAHGVIGFDTLALWRTPPQVDVAYFLLLLETIPPLFASRHWMLRAATVAELRREFLAGYYGNEQRDPGSLLLFEILVTLDKWASVVHSRHRSRGLRGAFKQARLAAQQRWLRSRLRKQLTQCEERIARASSGSSA